VLIDLSHAELGTYQFQPSKINPAEVALYGPAPVPHVPDTVTKSTDAPIGSRPTTSNGKAKLTHLKRFFMIGHILLHSEQSTVLVFSERPVIEYNS